MKEGIFLSGILAIGTGVWLMAGVGPALLTLGIICVVCALLALSTLKLR